jgi:hypothetical protein
MKPQSIIQSTEGFNVIFIHSSLDETDLTPVQFRVYAHLARRASGGLAWPSAVSIAKACHIHRDSVWPAVKALEVRQMISRENRPGRSNIWTVTTADRWIHSDPAKDQEESKGLPVGGKRGPTTRRKVRATKEIHVTDIQVKGEAVVGSTSQTSPPPPPKPTATPDRMALEQRMGMEAAEVRKRYADPKWKELGVNPKLVFHKLCEHCDPLGEPVTIERYDIWLKREWRAIVARPAKKGNGGWSRS